MENPFKYGGIVRGPFFANRNQELNELVREMQNLSRVFLISLLFGSPIKGYVKRKNTSSRKRKMRAVFSIIFVKA